MSAVSIVISKILEDSGVTAVVAQKVHPVRSPEGTQLPLIVVHLISSMDHRNISGAGRYFRSVVQVDSVAATGGGAIELGEKVIAALNGVVKATVAGCEDVDILLDDGSDFTEDDEQSSSARRVTRFVVFWRLA